MKAPRANVSTVANRLRDLSKDAQDKQFLGSEEELVSTIGAARATIRQAARLVEREGWLLVRRGMNGGYFAARPDPDLIEATARYLDMEDVTIEDVTYISSLLWVDVMRKACSVKTDQARQVAQLWHDRIAKVRPNTAFTDIIAIEQELRIAVFNLTKARYIELIFNINATFARKRYVITELTAARPDDRQFVRKWRDSKLAEFQAIIDGDPSMGMMAARFSRAIWDKRFFPADHLKIAAEVDAEVDDDM
jgi:GntR family transcriptional repressor for pyruvate dehydrogenase complex